MDYIDLKEESQLEELTAQSKELPNGVLIFKHSTRCAISKMALSRFGRGWDVEQDKLPVYFLDLIRYRDVSNKVSEHFGVQHESPQILLIRDGKCVYTTSHNAISPSDIQEHIV